MSRASAQVIERYTDNSYGEKSFFINCFLCVKIEQAGALTNNSRPLITYILCAQRLSTVVFQWMDKVVKTYREVGFGWTKFQVCLSEKEVSRRYLRDIFFYFAQLTHTCVLSSCEYYYTYLYHKERTRLSSSLWVSLPSLG